MQNTFWEPPIENPCIKLHNFSSDLDKIRGFVYILSIFKYIMYIYSIF
jgi:hypothetical protein